MVVRKMMVMMVQMGIYAVRGKPPSAGLWEMNLQLVMYLEC